MLPLIGIGYIFFPMLSIPLLIIGTFLDRKNMVFYFFGLILNLALIGYYYIPEESKDLYVHFTTMEYLKNISFESVINQYAIDPLIGKNILFYLIAKTNNYNILPFLAIFTTYFIIIKDLIYFGRKEGISNTLISSIAFGVIVWWALIWPMSGVRSSVVLALFFHGLFREFILGKKNWKTCIFYILPCLIHYSPVLLIVIRLLLPLYNKISTGIIIVFLLVWGLLVDQVLIILSKVNIPYITGLIGKVTVYDDVNIDSQYFIITNLFKLLFCILLIISYFMLKSKKNIIYESYRKFYDFGLLLSVFCIGGINNFIILDRFGYLVLAILPLFILPVIKFSKSKYIKSYLLLLYPAFLLIGLYINYIPLKTTNYGLTMYEFFSKNIIDILIH